MADGECPDCGHVWMLHPGVAADVRACAECIYEEDIGERGLDDMCRRTTDDKSEQVAARLLALLREEAEPFVREGRACVRVTTSGEHFGHSGDETAYVLLPTTEGALPVCLMPEGAAWCLLPGNGPSVEFWEGTDADYEQTRAFVRAVIAGRYRYSFEQRARKPLVFRWRPPTKVWLCTGRFTVDGEEIANQHGNAPPEPGEPLAVQATPY